MRGEEERFAETLDSGMRRIEEYRAAPGRAARPRVDGRFLFTLYDTYGFPRDLAEEILQDRGWEVTDETSSAWEAEMEAQRERARAGASFGAGDERRDAARSTSGSAPSCRPSQFVGYETLTTPAHDPGARARARSGCARPPRATRSR